MVVAQLIHCSSQRAIHCKKIRETEGLGFGRARVHAHPLQNLLYPLRPSVSPRPTRVFSDRNRRNVITLIDEIHDLPRFLHAPHDFLAHRAGHAERHADDRQLRVDRLHDEIPAMRPAASERVSRHQHARDGVLGRVSREDRIDAIVEPFVDIADAHRLRNGLQVRHHIDRRARAAQAVDFEVADTADEEFVVGIEDFESEGGTLIL